MQIGNVIERCKRDSATEDSIVGRLMQAFISSASFNLIDTVQSLSREAASAFLKDYAQKERWRTALRQCIKGADSAGMSQEEIISVMEMVTECLFGATIEIKKCILDKDHYIAALAKSLAGYDGSEETARTSRILEHVLQLLYDTLCGMPEFSKVCASVLKENVEQTRKLDDQVKELQDEISEQQSAEAFLKNLPAVSYNTNSMPFAYNYSKLKDICGREEEIKRINDFLIQENGRFRFCVVTGPAGIGKSKLVFYIACQFRQRKGWLVRKLDAKPLGELCNKKNWDIKSNALLIVDYADEQEQLPELLSNLSRLGEKGNKIRLILIARESAVPSGYGGQGMIYPQWYSQITREDYAIDAHLLQDGFMELGGLSRKECERLHTAFAEKHLRQQVSEIDRINVNALLEKEVEYGNQLVRPLYALFVIDQYYRNPDIQTWDIASLRQHIYLRDWKRWKLRICGKRIKKEGLFAALTELLVYATVFDGWISSTTLPEPLQEDCRIVSLSSKLYAEDKKKEWFRVLTGRTELKNSTPILPRLTPDMVGEYYALKRLSLLDDETLTAWAGLMASQLEECKEFLIRAIQDYGNEPDLLDTLIKLFDRMIGKIGPSTGMKTFPALLEELVQNYRGSESDYVYESMVATVSRYVEDNKTTNVYAAELALLLHENRPHSGMTNKIAHLEYVENLHERWPNSSKITSTYISFLGDIAASEIGSHDPGYASPYIKKIKNMEKLVDSQDRMIQKAFVPVLIKMIDRAYSIQDWNRATFFENRFLKKIMEHCPDALALDFIDQFDAVIVTLAIQHSRLAKSSAVNQIGQVEEILRNEIDFFKQVIESDTTPSNNFVWTYIGKLARITKNLFIHECTTEAKALCSYMLDEMKKTYNAGKNGIISWRVRRVMETFCDFQNADIPNNTREECLLWLKHIL